MKQQPYHKRFVGTHKLNPDTLMMSYGYDPKLSEGAVKTPLFMSSTFAFRTAEEGAHFFDVTSGRVKLNAEETSGLVYSRFNNPNLEVLEDRISVLEEADAACVFSSGMSAITTAAMAFLRPGMSMVMSKPIYGGTSSLFSSFFPDLGITVVPMTDGMSVDGITSAMNEAARHGQLGMVLIETPANPDQHPDRYRAGRRAMPAAWPAQRAQAAAGGGQHLPRPDLSEADPARRAIWWSIPSPSTWRATATWWPARCGTQRSDGDGAEAARPARHPARPAQLLADQPVAGNLEPQMQRANESARIIAEYVRESSAGRGHQLSWFSEAGIAPGRAVQPSSAAAPARPSLHHQGRTRGGVPVPRPHPDRQASRSAWAGRNR